ALLPHARWSALPYALLLFGPSTMLLGTVSPFAVRLSSHSVARVGNVAGRLYALSTAGSIFGTLFTAFYWIDVAGIRSITACIGWVLVALGVVLLAAALAHPEKRRPGGQPAIAIASLLLLLPAAARAPGRVVFRHDTMYHRITVED